jgi:hypothetical protein
MIDDETESDDSVSESESGKAEDESDVKLESADESGKDEGDDEGDDDDKDGSQLISSRFSALVVEGDDAESDSDFEE